MQQNFRSDKVKIDGKEVIHDNLDGIKYLIGNQSILKDMEHNRVVKIFDRTRVDFLNRVSKILMNDSEARAYSDVITLAFWIRKSSINNMIARQKNNQLRLGRGVAFHIAPSNVAVNYAYSFAVSFLMGNSNIVRIPTRDFPQVAIINRAIRKTILEVPEMEKYICFIQYQHLQEVNDMLSAMCDVRIVWGGDTTIAELRKSPLQPRAVEVTFADRYSIAVIHAEDYLQMENKEQVAQDFYNDTYLFDQNACTSPRMIVWTGNDKAQAKEEFWNILHEVVKKKYHFQEFSAIDKLVTMYVLAATHDGIHKVSTCDNSLVRVQVDNISDDIMEYKGKAGYFLEYDCNSLYELESLLNDKKCQTLAYIGDKNKLIKLIEMGVQGVDRIIPIGKTLDFDIIWDGYDLLAYLSRIVNC